jgi:cystathionine gamma-synthase
MRGFGVLRFILKGSFEAVRRFLTYPQLAANLGTVETVAGPPATTRHVECTAEERAAMGIPEGWIRYSAGIEDIEDISSDLEQALDGLE